MNIQYNEQKRVFKLDTDNTSYLIGIIDDEGFPAHIYYGAAIDDVDVAYRLRADDYPFLPSVNGGRERLNFLDICPTEFSGNCVGDFRQSAVEMLDENGTPCVQPLYSSHRIFCGKPELEGLPASFAGESDCMTLELVLRDSVLDVEIKLLYSVFSGSDVITRSAAVTNRSGKRLHLKKLMSLCLDIEDDDYKMLTLHGSWGRERQLEYRKIGYGRQSVGSLRGVSSHQEHPFLGLASENISQESGGIYGFNFVYSGNFIAEVEKDQHASLRATMGVHPARFDFLLEPGDTFTAPEVVMVYSDEGLGGMTRSLHDFYRGHLINPRWVGCERPVLINNWEATYFDFDTEKLLGIARDAKAAGIDMLVVDDGWFGKRNDDNSSLGDWTVNTEKLRGGLARLSSELNTMGMKLGLWFEPEMVSPDSELYRAHPDWALAVKGRTPCKSRNQYVLDLSRREVVEYVYRSVSDVLHSANIEYVKWDMNRALTDLGSAELPPERAGELMHRCTLAVYELQSRLTKEFPDLLLENCSSGGGRFDPGMLRYSPQIWCSDNTDAVERLSIQEGTALLYPLSTIGAHVSACPNHIVGRVTPFETRGHVAMAGTFGYELDVTKLTPEEKAMIPEQVAAYRRSSALLRSGDYYRIASYAENHVYDCWAVVAKDKSEALVTFVQVLAHANRRSRCIRIPGLAPEKRYAVGIEGMQQTLTGRTLARAGVMIPQMNGDFRSMQFWIREAKE